MSESTMTISLIALLKLINGETVDIRLSEKFHFTKTKNGINIDEKDKQKCTEFINKMNSYLEHLEKNPVLQDWYTSILQLDARSGDTGELDTSFINNLWQFKEEVKWITGIITQGLKFEKINLNKKQLTLRGKNFQREEDVQQIMQSCSKGLEILRAPIRVYGVLSSDKHYVTKIFFNNPLEIEIDLPWKGHIAKKSLNDYNNMIKTLNDYISNKKDTDHAEGFMSIEFFPKISLFPNKYTDLKSLCLLTFYFYKVADIKSFLKYLQTDMLQLKLPLNFPDMALDQTINTPLLFGAPKISEFKEEEKRPEGLMARVCKKLSCFS